MNENKMLNDKPIFVAKSRTFHGLILAATCLMIALASYSFAQEPEVDKLKQVALWVCGVVMSGVFGVGTLYLTLIFKKIMLFDDRIEVYCVNKVIVRTYSQIKSFELLECKYGIRRLVLECEPDFMHAYLDTIFLHINELYKIKENLIKKGAEDKG